MDTDNRVMIVGGREVEDGIWGINGDEKMIKF